MKIYVLASFRMEADEGQIRNLTGVLNALLKQYSVEGHFLNVTTSEASFLNDARRLVKGDPPMIPFNGCRICKSKKSRKRCPGYKGSQDIVY